MRIKIPRVAHTILKNKIMKNIDKTTTAK